MKQDSAGTTKPLWGLQQILLETDQHDVTQVVYTRDPLFGSLLSQIRAASTSHALVDALGSTTSLTDDSGLVTDTFIYRAFGAIVSAVGTTSIPFTFDGQLGYYYDSDLSSYCLWTRYYDPASGRFLSHHSSYSFGDNNPLNAGAPQRKPKVPPHKKDCEKAVQAVLASAYYNELRKRFPKCPPPVITCADDQVCRQGNAAGKPTGYTIPGSPPTIVICSENSVGDYENNIRHELVHYFDFCMNVPPPGFPYALGGGAVGGGILGLPGLAQFFPPSAVSCATVACAELTACAYSGQCINDTKHGGQRKPGQSVQDCIYSCASRSLRANLDACKNPPNPPFDNQAQFQSFAICCQWKKCTQRQDFPCPPRPKPKQCDVYTHDLQMAACDYFNRLGLGEGPVRK